MLVQESSDPKLEYCDGYCDSTTKRIVVEDFKADIKSVEDLELYKRQVVMHEIIHAFLYESGLHGSSWATNEEIVDYIAIQFPKVCGYIFNGRNYGLKRGGQLLESKSR